MSSSLHAVYTHTNSISTPLLHNTNVCTFHIHLLEHKLIGRHVIQIHFDQKYLNIEILKPITTLY